MWATIKGWIFYLVLALSIVVMAVCVLVTTPMTSAKWRFVAICRRWTRFVLWALERICGVHYEIRGAENFPSPEQPTMVLCKHQSAWDPFWLGSYLPTPACYLYKRSLNYIPFLGWALWAMDMLAIDRKKGRSSFQAFYEKGAQKLKDGWWICLFPEGTRVPPGKTVPFKTGGARVACATGTPILPIAHNAGRYWPKNSIAKYPGTITVVVGPLIPTEGRTPQEVTHDVEAWIYETCRDL